MHALGQRHAEVGYAGQVLEGRLYPAVAGLARAEGGQCRDPLLVAGDVGGLRFRQRAPVARLCLPLDGVDALVVLKHRVQDDDAPEENSGVQAASNFVLREETALAKAAGAEDKEHEVGRGGVRKPVGRGEGGGGRCLQRSEPWVR